MSDQLSERRDWTHTLRIDVPLNLEANPAAAEWDIQGALAEAMRAVLPLIRLGTLGLLCGDPNVSLEVSGAEVGWEDRRMSEERMNYVGEWPLSSGLMCVDPAIANRNDTGLLWQCRYCRAEVVAGALHQCREDHRWEEPFVESEARTGPGAALNVVGRTEG